MNTPRRRIGEGYISGYISLTLGIAACLAVACLCFPEWLTTPEIRANLSPQAIDWMFYGGLSFCFIFGFISSLLCSNKKFAFWGTALGTIALLSATYLVPVVKNTFGTGDSTSPLYLGLDWLIIDLLATAALFVPLELAFPKKENQSKFHPEWVTDFVYFAVSHIGIGFFGLIAQQPATLLFAGIGLEGVHAWTASLPFLPALLLLMVLSDIGQYWTHRLFHTSRYLWRFHAIHHSTRAMDWMSGSRTHFLDVFLVRAVSFVPIFVLGFEETVFATYILIVSIQAVLAHANTRLLFGPIRYLLVTPQYHHWHHSADPAVYGKNYAIHFPLIDWIFGTCYIPKDEWTEETGLDDANFPKGYLRQAVYPFTHDPFAEPDKDVEYSTR